MKCRGHFALLPDIFCFEAMPSRSELEIDRFWQPIERRFDVGMVRRALALRDVDVGADRRGDGRFKGAAARPVEHGGASTAHLSASRLCLYLSNSTVASGRFGCIPFQRVRFAIMHSCASPLAALAQSAVLFERDGSDTCCASAR